METIEWSPALFDQFLRLNHLPSNPGVSSLEQYWEELSWEEKDASGWELSALRSVFDTFLAQQGVMQDEISYEINSLQVLSGQDKNGRTEDYDLEFFPGDVICLVGPTGAGKSRFLGDIECLAQRDTPSKRQILINGKLPDNSRRFSGESGMIAQITQNMNFVMDLPVREFLLMHAESRSLSDPETVVDKVMQEAICMSGEQFQPTTQITQLSGGQSRALMIADAAYLSPRPIILIDEIENAGVDRIRALQLFVEKEKIVLLSTHDPLLALSGTCRLVIRNGAVVKVLKTSHEEQVVCSEFAKLDKTFAQVRNSIRRGERISSVQIP
jgi:ABC-type lipoprotein export system ATPase subunit